jgi:gliding motility-associated-like protein
MKSLISSFRAQRGLLSLCFSLCVMSVMSQTPGEWTWMHGSNNSATAVTGVQGIPSDDVKPMAVYEGRSWVDLNGNFWLYSGLANTSDFVTSNYLWRYIPSTNQWTWMKGNQTATIISSTLGTQGIAAPENSPSGCDLGNSAAWVDLNGDLWLLNADSFLGMCVMWKYEIATNNWIWMGGGVPFNYGTQGVSSSLNNPEMFYESPISWVQDDGSLWFLDGYNGGVMWKYDTNSNEWTWMSGVEDTGFGSPLVVGDLGEFNSSNQPGTTWVYPSWKSDDNKFYIFGPQANFNLGGEIRSSMWCFDPAINQWAWVGGIQTATLSNFDGYCSFSPTNVPATGWEYTCSWKDDCGLFWGYNEIDTFLWCYDPAINQFALISGSLTGGDPVFGTLGVSDPSNDPGGSSATPHWTDLDGNLWKMGSYASFAVSNALWRYVPDPLCVSTDCFTSPVQANFSVDLEEGCVPLIVDFTNNSINALEYVWTFGDGGSSTLENPSHTYTSSGTYTVTLIASDGEFADTTFREINVKPQANASFNAQINSLCEPFSVELINTSDDADDFLWFLNGELLDEPDSLIFNFTEGEYEFMLVANNDFNCPDTAISSLSLLDCPDIYLFIPNVFSPDDDQFNNLFEIQSSGYEDWDLKIFNRWGVMVYESTNPSRHWNGRAMGSDEASPTGTYFYVLNAKDIFGKSVSFEGHLTLLREGN